MRGGSLGGRTRADVPTIPILKRRPPWCEAVETSEEVGPRASGSSECGKEKERARMALDRVGAGGEEVTAGSEPEGPMKALS